MSLKLPKLPSDITESSKETALRLQKLLAVFNAGGDKDKKELAAWGINRQYYLRSMFYMYLFNKYGNSCIIDVNPPCNILPDICEHVGDMVLKVYGFEYIKPNSIDKIKWKAYQKYLQDYSKKIHKCLKHRKIVVVPVRLHWPGSGDYRNDAQGGSHANLLVVRKSNNTVEVVEPHGSRLGTSHPRMNPNKAYTNVVDMINKTLPRKSEKYNIVFSDEVCPYLTGIQSLEGYANIFKDNKVEGGGYCSIWSMFTTEMILSNPDFTTRQVMQILLDMLYKNTGYLTHEYGAKVKVGNYLLLVARGYATFITKKVEQYFSDIYGETAARAIKLGRTASYSEIAEMRRFFGPFLKIQAELSLDPKMTLAKLKTKLDKDKIKVEDKTAYKQVLERLIKKDIRYSVGTTRSTGLAIELKYKDPCPKHLFRNPKTGRCIKPRNKTQKNTVANKNLGTIKKKECPPGKELNPKTNRCRKIKATKKTKTKIKLISKPRQITPKKSPQPKILKKQKVKTPTRKRCPNGTRRNPKTKLCEPKKKKEKKKKVLKIVQQFTKKKTPTIVVKKVDKKTRRRCPNGTRRDKKTGNCLSKK